MLSLQDQLLAFRAAIGRRAGLTETEIEELLREPNPKAAYQRAWRAVRGPIPRLGAEAVEEVPPVERPPVRVTPEPRRRTRGSGDSPRPHGTPRGHPSLEDRGPSRVTRPAVLAGALTVGVLIGLIGLPTDALFASGPVAIALLVLALVGLIENATRRRDGRRRMDE